MTTEAYIFAGIALFMYIMGVVLIFAAFRSFAKPKARLLIALALGGSGLCPDRPARTRRGFQRG